MLPTNIVFVILAPLFNRPRFAIHAILNSFAESGTHFPGKDHRGSTRAHMVNFTP